MDVVHFHSFQRQNHNCWTQNTMDLTTLVPTRGLLNSLVFIHQADEVLDAVLAGPGPFSGPGSAGRRTRAEKALSECEDPPQLQ